MSIALQCTGTCREEFRQKKEKVDGVTNEGLSPIASRKIIHDVGKSYARRNWRIS
jgi:hypothetical protein